MSAMQAPPPPPEQAVAIREAGLWSDAWRQLRRNPLFVGSAVLIASSRACCFG